VSEFVVVSLLYLLLLLLLEVESILNRTLFINSLLTYRLTNSVFCTPYVSWLLLTCICRPTSLTGVVMLTVSHVQYYLIACSAVAVSRFTLSELFLTFEVCFICHSFAGRHQPPLRCLL